jgi:hypothetical protein
MSVMSVSLECTAAELEALRSCLRLMNERWHVTRGLLAIFSAI